MNILYLRSWLKDKLTPIQLEDDETLVSFDVTALYTNVPIEDAVAIIGDMLRKDDTLPSLAWLRSLTSSIYA